jgi:hypothetical protein
MQEMHAMKKTGQKCVGPFNMSGHLALGVFSIATNTGQSLWSKPKTEMSLSFSVRKA